MKRRFFKMSTHKKSVAGSSKTLLNPSTKLRPSEFLTQSLVDVHVDEYPLITEFMNIKDNTAQVHSIVDVDKPIFTPSPTVVVFEDYAPFAIHEKKMFFRNHDKVARRIKVLQPDTPFFEVTAPRNSNGQPLKQSKIAAGMEVCFVVRFKPQEVRDYTLDLVCVTEREKFIVPVRAVGNRPRMSFPDSIDFGTCPVKSTSRKMVLAQNIGSCSAKFRLYSHNPAFTVTSDDMTVEPGGYQMVEVFFTPNGQDVVESEIEVEYTKKLRCFIKLSGAGKNVDVSLSTPSLTLEPSFISLSSQSTLRIHNHSEIAINFSWKSFANVSEEDDERGRLHTEITRMEELEEQALLEAAHNGEYGSPNHSDVESDDGEFNDGKGLSFEAKAAKSSLIRKYRNLRKALEHDPMFFVDDIFEITPVEGTVWAKSEIEITVSFRPDTAAAYSCLGYLDISGREDRLPLHLSGTGIGPNAGLSFDIFDIGDVFINSMQKYEVTISNKGDIPAQWSLIPPTSRLSRKFKFWPNDGLLEIGKSDVISIQFASDILGEFSEMFNFALQGSEEPLQCIIKGQVVGPTFHFDCKTIDFGIVSYDILQTMTTVLVNTSDVSMDYKLYVPQDGTYVKKEIEIKPSQGMLQPGASVEIEIFFVPHTVKVYNYTLAIDIEGVGEAVTSIPLLAECIVSSILLPQRELTFGDCFIRYPYEQEMTLINNSNVVETKCTILPQQQFSKSVAKYTVEPETVVVPIGGSSNVKFTFHSEKLGNFKIPVVLVIAGSQEPPMQASISCVSVGPIVESDKTEIRWGNVDCLQDSSRTISLKNTSWIAASCKIFLKMARSKYSLSAEEVVLEPGQEFELTVTANLDDTIVHEDELHVMVHEGHNLMIPLIARGIGTSMFCEQDITKIDFEVQLTNMSFEKKITLENKGRRQQNLKWTNITNREENLARAVQAKKYAKEGKKVPKSLMPLDPHFIIEPAEIVLRPRTATTFTFKGYHTKVGAATEHFILESKLGKDRGFKTIINTEICADIVDPLLTFSEKELNFTYSWCKTNEPSVQQKEMTLTNQCAIDLNFLLKVDVPFNLSCWDYTLAPGQSVSLIVEFDPLYRDDLLSHSSDKQLVVSYRGHPQKDTIQLHADILFPNLQFDTSTINFGCVLNDTAKKNVVRVTNVSKLEAAYEWIFLEQDNSKGKFSQSQKNSTKNRMSAFPPGQIFDILPIRSVLKPGATEEVEFTMFGHTNAKFSNTALCKVEGGPEYKLLLQGEASTVSYALDRDFIEFGEVLFSEKKDESLVVSNMGKVAFNFSSNVDGLSHPGLVEIIPAQAKIAPGDVLKLTIRFRPGVPANFAETIILNVAHFDPVRVRCYCKGIFPAIAVTLPRHKRYGPFGELHQKGEVDLWPDFSELARNNIMIPDQTMAPSSQELGKIPPNDNSGVAPVYNVVQGPVDDETMEPSPPKVPRLKKKEPSQIALDVEMHRMAFCHHLRCHQEKMLTTEIIVDTAPPTLAKSTGIHKKMSSSKVVADVESDNAVSSIVVANYICDFGNVISATTKKKVFKIMNAATAGPISWVFDKQQLAGSGFSIEPDRVNKLPEAGSVDIVVKFFAKPKLSPGRVTVTMPVSIKNAPVVNLMFSVNICMPDIEMTTDTLEFDRVQLGRCKRMFINFKNISPVTTHWSLKKPGHGKDENRFTVIPSEGSIKSGGSTVIEVEYVPTEARKQRVALSLKIDMNPKNKKTLTLNGEGVGTPVRFDPPLVELGPILPFSAGTEKEVTVFNDGDQPVELYSLDFDSSYVEEDSILQAVDVYEADGMYRAPMRMPGEPLPEHIMEAYRKREEAVEGDDDTVVLRKPKYQTEDTPRAHKKHQDILVVGPSLVGKSSTSLMLSKTLELPLFEIDQILKDVAQSTAKPAGEVARRLLGLATEVEKADYTERLAALKVAADASTAKKKKKDEEVSPETQAMLDFEQLGTFCDKTVAIVVSERLLWDDSGYGAVFDGVSSVFAAEKVILEGICFALPDIVISHLKPTGEAEGYKDMLTSLYALKSTEVADLTLALSEKQEDSSRKSFRSIRSVTRGITNTARSNNTARDKVLASARKNSSIDKPVVVDDKIEGVEEKQSAIEGNLEDQPLVECVPVGDEHWVDVKTGLVMQLNDDDFKSLETDQKESYMAQLTYQRHVQLNDAKCVISKILQLWNAETKELRVKEVEAEGIVSLPLGDRVMFYSSYLSEVNEPLLQKFPPRTLEHDNEVAKIDSTTETEIELASTNLFTIEFDENQNIDDIVSIMKAILPAPLVPPRDKNSLPSPALYQIFRRPLTRLERKPVRNFVIKRVPDDGNIDTTSEQFRWVIPSKSSFKFNLQFQSNVEGKTDNILTFEVMGTQQTYNLYASGVCEVPHINDDSRNVFMRRVNRLNPGIPPPQKRFVSSEDFYSFGPLLKFKESIWRVDPSVDGKCTDEAMDRYKSVEATNLDILRISNNGKYPCTVDLGFEKKAAAEDVSHVFFVEPEVLALSEGETKDIRVWGFPKDAQEYNTTLVACISDNPKPVMFDLKCWGVEPTIELIGSWEKLLQSRIAELDEVKAEAKPDPKIVKEMESKIEQLKGSPLIDFDRILIDRTELQTFTMKNTCLLPISWEIDPQDFKDSPNLTISPLSGVVEAGGSISIAVSFYSRDPLMLSGVFTIRYSDNENGLANESRVLQSKVNIQAEAYNIQAVSLTAKGEKEGGNEVSLGRIRVGDFVTKNVKMGNNGKYSIGYKFYVKKSTTNALLNIEPSEGVIESGQQADVAITFCSADAEVFLKGNKDVRVIISEPKTGENIEEFNMVLSVEAVFNKFRMQPAKGISFGAMRFDSDVKTKRIELRNEGSFEFAYVVCGALAEVDEIDLFDSETLSCYAYHTPPARRITELGENFKDRMQSDGSGGGKGKKDTKKAPPTKKGTASTEGDSCVTHDPDELSPVDSPANPLEIGSFWVGPRVGVIQPGESIGIDVKFNPAGCKTMREKFRICVSGVDPAATPSQWARSFEVVGESCTPCIVTDDIQSIFEEQEVIHSLSDIKSGTEGSVKIENIGIGKVVYSQVEKMLAFGPVMCTTVGGRSGSVERIRITNPTKIDVKASFAIKSVEESSESDPKAAAKGKGKDAKGKKDAPVEMNHAFSVHPETWEIPPHEHRYVNIHFNPTEMKTYRSSFFAVVEDQNSEAQDTELKFDLGGSGTMPCISVEQPTERDLDGNLIIDFDRVHADRTSCKTFIIRNDGIMTTTCLFDMPPGTFFSFPSKDSSLTLNAGEKQELQVNFCPVNMAGGMEENCSSQIKISVLNNPFDKYYLKLKGTAYACDAIIETQGDDHAHENVIFEHLNLANNSADSMVETVLLRSRCKIPLKFAMKLEEGVPDVFSFSPSVGHLGPLGVKEVRITFNSNNKVLVENGKVSCSLQQISYTKPISEDETAVVEVIDTSLHGKWDNSMSSLRPATDEDMVLIEESAKAFEEYEVKAAAEAAKGKKGKPVPKPADCPLKLANELDDGTKMVEETVLEPASEIIEGVEKQNVHLYVSASADVAKYECGIAGQNINFRPTFLFQSSSHSFTFKNESKIEMPVAWNMESIKRQVFSRSGSALSTRQASRTASRNSQTIPCPFFITPEDCIVPPETTQTFNIKFQPLEVEDFMYVVTGQTIPCAGVEEGSHTDGVEPLRFFIKGEAKRPICHFNITESPDYMLRRSENMKNEIGLHSPIEATDIRVVEMESVGLRLRNVFRFSVVNPTSENYEFKWEPLGDPSPFWRCAMGSGMLFSGKSTEMTFEYLPEEDTTAESFFKFTLPSVGLSQIFLFAGNVIEPRVAFSTSKIDFHSVMLNGEGGSETLYIHNQEHVPFPFAFDKVALQNLVGPAGPILSINPRSGTVGPNSKFAVELLFKPQEEVLYNLNISCDIKRKPNKLSVNIKGEGYAVHPLIQIENAGEIVDGVQSHYTTLRPAPAINYADFGAVQVLDSVSKTLMVTNNGKYNFDYNWETDIDVMNSSNLTLSGGKSGGTLHKGAQMEYNITFAPVREVNIDGAMLTFIVAGKYVYNVMAKGNGVQPAVRFSFNHFDFGSCFITSPGGNTVVEETVLRIVNHDPVNNIAVDCSFQKTRALWADCPPVVLDPGAGVDVPIRFAPRDVKEYSFVIPFVINGTGKVNVNVTGQGILPRLELLNASQRRTNFGIVDVGSELSKTVVLVNKSKRELPVQLVEEGAYGGSALNDHCISYFPSREFIIPPRDKASVQLVFSPSRRIAQFSEDLMVRYAGITRKLINVSGKAQGSEVSLDTDSLPFGVVVTGSGKVKKLSLENSGDLSLTFQWVESTFGHHFSISPLQGKLSPGNEVTFDVAFNPKYIDPDIRQENILLSIPGMSPLSITCSGSCVEQPDDSINVLDFNSLVRKEETKSIELKNPTDKDWFVSPSISGAHWSVPNEIRIPPKGSANLAVTFFPIVMCEKVDEDSIPLEGSLFTALPDGSAHMYKLRGFAAPPASEGTVKAETTAKQHCMIPLKMNNWLPDTQKFRINIDVMEQPSPATFFVAANAVEVAPHGIKDFQIRFNSFVEGTTKAKATFTNEQSGEYFFYDIEAKALSAEVLNTINLESSVRQSARHLLSIENPLDSCTVVTMGASEGAEWWSCDSKSIRVKELVGLSGNSEGSYEIEYRPLTPTKQPMEHLLTIMTKELGTFKYKIVVKATTSSVRQTLHFEVPLGSVQAETFVFKTFNSTQSTFKCSVKQPTLFSVNDSMSCPAVSAWDGDDARQSVRFEPTSIGEVRDVLFITSPEGGDYECELVGRCVPPLPLGPYNFVAGASQAIPFRNCFDETCQWSFVVDSPSFQVSTSTASVAAKSEGSCSVTFNQIADSASAATSQNDTVTSKLFIRCDTKPDIPPWIVYLRGKI